MKKLLLIIILIIAPVVLFVGGFVSGIYLSDYDVLCEQGYTRHLLKKEFKSKEGIILPSGTIIFSRGCKPNINARLEFYIDNWNHENLQEIEANSHPVYYLNSH